MNQMGTSVPSDTSKYLRCIQAMVQGPFVWSRAAQVGARWRFVSNPPPFPPYQPYVTLLRHRGRPFGDETDLGCFFLLGWVGRGGGGGRRGGVLACVGVSGYVFQILGYGRSRCDYLSLIFGHRKSQRKKARALTGRVICFLLPFDFLHDNLV